MKNNSDLESIYNTYVDDLYYYGVYLGFDRNVIMDAIHDVFFNLCSNKEYLNNVQNLKFYLIRSLKNNLINTHKTTRETVTLNDIENSEDFTINIEDELISKEKASQINEKVSLMLESLTKKQQEIVYLRYILEYSYDQIAEILQITPGSCRKLVHKAMQRLRENYPLLVVLLLSIFLKS